MNDNANATIAFINANRYEEAGVDSAHGLRSVEGKDGFQHMATGLHIESVAHHLVTWGCYLSGRQVGLWCTASITGRLVRTIEHNEHGQRHGAEVKYDKDGYRTVTWWVRGECVPCDTQTGDAGLPF